MNSHSFSSSSRTSVELLEQRIAPAAVYTFTDVDGDKVTIKTSKGSNSELAAILTLAEVSPGKQQLQSIDFSADPDFAGTNLTITAKKSATGDGLVNVGFIDAFQTGNNDVRLDLGKIMIKGDLGAIAVGDAVATTAAVKSLNVASLGRFGTATQAAGAYLISSINGSVDSIKVTGDIYGATIIVDRIGNLSVGGSVIGGPGDQSGSIFATTGIDKVTIKGDLVGGQGSSTGVIQGGYLESVLIGGSIIGGSGNSSAVVIAGELGSIAVRKDIVGGSGIASGVVAAFDKLSKVTVGGSLIGGAGVDTGLVLAKGEMGIIKIGGSLVGGDGNRSGYINSEKSIESITIGGSVVGGSGDQSGAISSVEKMGPIKIGKDVIGGKGGLSGRIRAGEFVAAGNGDSVQIGGSLIGGSGDDSGQIFSAGDIGPVRLGGNLIGGSVSGTASLNGSGLIQGNHISSITIGGSIISGVDSSTGTLTNSGAIRAAEDIGLLQVKGKLFGNATNPVLITASGQASPTSGTDLAIGKVDVGGNVDFASILAGYSEAKTPVGVNGKASIGPVTVGGNWHASNLVAGVADLGAPGFGTADDELINTPGGNTLVARIASIQIQGSITGTADNNMDHFGFTAKQIGAFKVGGVSIPLTSGTDQPVELAVSSGDVTIREI